MPVCVCVCAVLQGAVRIAQCLPAGAKLLSVEANRECVLAMEGVLTHAGWLGGWLGECEQPQGLVRATVLMVARVSDGCYPLCASHTVHGPAQIAGLCRWLRQYLPAPSLPCIPSVQMQVHGCVLLYGRC